MRKIKPEIYLAAFILLVIAATAFLYLQTQEKNAYGMFPEKLGDMSIALYREGDAAMADVKSLHRGANVEIENAYIVNYRSTPVIKAKFWVSESKTKDKAVSLLESMNSRVGKTGMFSDSTPLNIEGITVYFVTGRPELGLYHYFYARDKIKLYKIFWKDKQFEENFSVKSAKYLK